jgi:hypothetical protein
MRWAAFWGIVACLAVRPAAAQDPGGPQGVRVELSYVHATFTPSTHLDELGAGNGFDLALAFHLDPHVMLVAGVQSTHLTRSDSTTDGSPTLHPRASETQIFAEPRLVATNLGRIQPFLFVRLAYVRSSQTLPTIDDDGNTFSDITVQDGSGIGGGVGVTFSVSRRFNLHAAGAWQRVSLGNLTFSGSTVPDTKAVGSSIVIRVGGSIDLGGFHSGFMGARGSAPSR